jgi:formyl-CoA transferase
VLEAFAGVDAAIAPIYSAAEIVRDPQYLARETINLVEHPTFGPILMQNVIPRLLETPGRISRPGAELGEHNAEVSTGELGLSPELLQDYRGAGVI